MNKYQKEVEKIKLKMEEETLDRLEKTYVQATKDVKKEIKRLDREIQNLIDLDVENKTLIRSKVYQLKYQTAMLENLKDTFKVLADENVKNVGDFLEKMYDKAYLGQIYNLHQKDIPVYMPVNHKSLAKSVYRDIDGMKFSRRLYKNVDKVKKEVVSEISRGIASGFTVDEISVNISDRLGVSMRKAYTIARTEGGRVSIEASYDSIKDSISQGADLVKVWDSTLDKKTRPHHRELDGQYAEIDEPFKYSGGEVQAPHQFGIASEDVNCRCALLSTPRWDIEENYKKRDNITGETIEAKNYYDWEKKYYNALENDEIIKANERVRKSKENARGIINQIKKAYNDVEKYVFTSEVAKRLEVNKVEYNEVAKLNHVLSTDKIIERLGGGDMTKGSCASLSFAYAGNKVGLDVLDFRGGNSQSIFSRTGNIFEIAKLDGVNSTFEKGYNDVKNAVNLLKQMEKDKEFILITGKHASIVKHTDDGYLYLELQSRNDNGYHKLDTKTLQKRFGCTKTCTISGIKFEQESCLIDVETLGKNKEFQNLLGYINTNKDKQMKGAKGRVK